MARTPTLSPHAAGLRVETRLSGWLPRLDRARVLVSLCYRDVDVRLEGSRATRSAGPEPHPGLRVGMPSRGHRPPAQARSARRPATSSRVQSPARTSRPSHCPRSRWPTPRSFAVFPQRFGPGFDRGASACGRQHFPVARSKGVGERGWEGVGVGCRGAAPCDRQVSVHPASGPGASTLTWAQSGLTTRARFVQPGPGLCRGEGRCPAPWLQLEHIAGVVRTDVKA